MKRSPSGNLPLFLILCLFIFSIANGQKPVENSPTRNIIIILDNSGSMKSNDPDFLTRNTVRSFIEKVDAGTRISLLLFDTEARLVLPLVFLHDKDTIREALNSLEEINYKGKYTNIPVAVERAIYELNNNSRAGDKKNIILLTDGFIDTGNPEEDQAKSIWLRNSLAREASENSIKIYGIAFTEKADFQLLQELAQTTGGKYFRALNLSDIAPVFNKIYNEISQPDKVEVEVKEKPVETKANRYPLPLLIGLLALVAIITAYFMLKRKNTVTDTGSRKEPESRSDDLNRTVRIDPTFPPARIMDAERISGMEFFAISKPKVLIGRSTENDLCLARETISGFHASIIYELGKFYITDNHSRNGTRLNGELLKPGVKSPLMNGDQILIDRYRFTFSCQVQMQNTVIRPLGTGEQKNPERDLNLPKQEPVSPRDPEDDDGTDLPTKLLQRFCPDHPGLKATELCPLCKKAYCNNCMIKVSDSLSICHNCHDKSN